MEQTQTAYATALAMLSAAMQLPLDRQIPYVNRVAQLAAGVRDEADEKAWLQLRTTMHKTVRKVMVAVHELAERFEDFDLHDPGQLAQLELWPQERGIPHMYGHETAAEPYSTRT